MGITDNDKGVGVDALHQLLHRDDVAPAEGAQNDLRRLVGIGSGAVQQRNAQIQLQKLPGDLLMFLADNVGHFGGVAAIDHLVHHGGADVQHGDAVQRLGQLAEGQGIGDDDHQVNGQAQLADGKLLHLQLDQPGRQLRAAGGGALPQHEAEGRAADNTAVYAGQHRLQRLKAVDGVDAVDHQRTDRHGVQRADQHVPSQQLQAQNEQRHVHHQRHHAHGEPREKDVQHLGHTGQSADGHMTGHAAPAEAQRVQRAAKGDDPVLLQFFRDPHITPPC